MNDKMNPITIQKQVRDNNEDVTNFMRDLKHWEEDMKKKESELKKLKPDSAVPPIRNEVRKSSEGIAKKKSVSTNPSKPNKIAGFDYASWDRFDVDKACAEMDGEENEVPESDEENEESESDQDLDERLREEAIYEKEKGNRLVMNGKWTEAIQCYTRAIECYSHDAIYYANRALCYLKTNNFQLAETDCSSSLEFDDMYVKAYQRRAAARQGLGDLIGARDDLGKVLELEPMNTSSKAEFIKIEKLINYSLTTIKERRSTENMTEVNPENFGSTSEEGIKLVNPIKKPPHLRSKKPLKRIIIVETVNGVSKEEKLDTESGVNNSLSTNSTPVLKPTYEINSQEESNMLVDDEQDPVQPNSSVEFLVGWKRVKSNPKFAYRYLKQIPGQNFPNIFQESLDSSTFSDIISTLAEEFLLPLEPVLPYIVGLSNVKRLSALTMFMTAADKMNLNKLLAYCIETGECKEQELHYLKEKFELLL